MNEAVRNDVQGFFNRRDTFVLGVCNGCQMLSALSTLIPGVGISGGNAAVAEDDGGMLYSSGTKWPRLVRNQSCQFEARISLVKILPSPCIFLKVRMGVWIAKDNVLCLVV